MTEDMDPLMTLEIHGDTMVNISIHFKSKLSADAVLAAIQSLVDEYEHDPESLLADCSEYVLSIN